MRTCAMICARWSSRRREAIRNRRCCGLPRAFASSARACATWAIRSAARSLANSCTSSITACKPTARPARDPTIPIVTCNSTTSTVGLKKRARQVSRRSRSTPRRRSLSATSRTPDANGDRRARPRKFACTISSFPNSGAPHPTASTISPKTSDGSAWGIDHDTAAFAANAIRSWWKLMGRERYPSARSLLITADGGGSNGSRVRLWKIELQKLADELGVPITVCHLPPGTSKWNKIEHRLFSFITGNWRGKPLVSHQVIVQLIAATTTKTGLKVRCELDQNTYPAGIKVSDAEMEAVNITRHDFHGEWNYTVSPKALALER